jgi:muramoyltetrapeptide carboxypeptidase
MLRFPDPLKPGDRIGVTSPSAGVAEQEAERIDFCIGWLREGMHLPKPIRPG